MKPLNTLLVGCGGMGQAQARIIAQLPGYKLVAVCDAVAANAKSTGEKYGCAYGTDVAALLHQHRPEVMAICTWNDSHPALTLQAVAAGVRAVYCEKPMAVHLADARAMVAACAKANVRLVVNHQRRTGADLLAMKQAIDHGAIGQVRRIRVQCAGDALSDGTHAIDSLRFLMGEAKVEWVLGQIHRDDPALKPQPKQQSDRPGWRFGHPIEDAAMAQIQFSGNLRGEYMGGQTVEPYCAYQYYEVFGTTGRLWRCGDAQPCAAAGQTGPAVWDPNIFISDGTPGTHSAVFDLKDWPYRPKPHPGGEWRVLPPVGDPLANRIAASYEHLAEILEQGGDHPMDGSVGLADLELVTAIYASAQQGRKITLDELPGQFPLYAMCPDAKAVS